MESLGTDWDILLLPLLVTYAISVIIFPIQPWDILNTIGKKRKIQQNSAMPYWKLNLKILLKNSRLK